MKKWVLILAAAILFSASLSQAADPLPRVQLSTSMGDIVVELNPAAAPKTVDNFLAYVNAGFYNGTIFHRVIAGFMVQGGGYDEKMQRRKPTRPPIVNEADNGLSNRIGSIAMARTADPHSANAQFFINVKDNDFLDHRGKTQQGWGYCVFGKVVSGMNVVKAIENVPTTARAGMRDVPVTPVVIKAVTLLTTPANSP
ncbi:peptidyl-prolyl cis-trans isomerase A (rotamase A) [Desulfosarcina cetonica]|nr:peptidyl-prolyl cis-trans isomerase A (rotamase A) [Desulfosarcina cetonica]